MKKSLSIIAVAALIAGACSKADNEMHRTTILYPTNGSLMVFADQTLDSLKYETTDQHTLFSTASWCVPDNDFLNDFKMYDHSIYSLMSFVTFEPNTTGKQRTATVMILGEKCSAAAMYCQVPYLAVSRPTRMVHMQNYDAYTYELTDSAHFTTDSVCFYVYGDWSLTPKKGEWVRVQRMQGMKGQQTVRLNLTPNTTGADRRDTLLLESNGVVDSLPLLQLAAQ